MSTTARTNTGDLQLPRVIVTDFASCVLQSIKDALALWKGEWFLDQNAGFPWGQQVLGVKIVSTAQIEALLRQQLLAIQGVIRVTAKSVFNRALRNFAYTFTAYLSTGQQITGGSATPFVITGAP